MREIDKIVLHHSLTKDNQLVSWNAIRRYHIINNGWSDCGYHMGIELVGGRYETFLGRSLLEDGAHAKGFNRGSIGICMVGNFDLGPPPYLQLLELNKLIKMLQEIFPIPNRHIFFHRDFNKYKTCPGKNFAKEVIFSFK